MHHELKTDKNCFEASCKGKKYWEIRYNDRDFKVGDTLTLRETVSSGSAMADGAPLEYTGRTLSMYVDYILHGPVYGLEAGWVIMSVAG